METVVNNSRGSPAAAAAAGEAAIVDERFCFEEETHLTVHKTSVFVPGASDGFIVYNPAGEIIFRVDSYGPDSASKDELVLMDSTGKSLVTLLRKKPSLHQRWEGFLGENHDQEPIFSIFKSSIIGQFNVVAVVHGHDSEKEYHVEGSFVQRCCSIVYDGQAAASHNNSESSSTSSKEIVAEIKRKVDPDRNIMLGKDVFLLCLKPSVDAAFMMALLLILDRISGSDSDMNDSFSSQVHDVLDNDSSS
ncbi:OLC1v1038002C2 [Oldenlandia corymbosa var. corymbosa]|uniref:OLC1v1038002C2 n=1 Tax=Oldenlandia corymbosa var. corymbosa TaxID=529605 RepID=A0AAV1CZX9_OLDCO|nr:OLC1v1038002C2 [Oldenlandia corymbosa var. corymbosa]